MHTASPAQHLVLLVLLFQMENLQWWGAGMEDSAGHLSETRRVALCQASTFILLDASFFCASAHNMYQQRDVVRLLTAAAAAVSRAEVQNDLDSMIEHKRLAQSAGTIRQLSSQLSEYRHTILAASSHNLQVPSPPLLLRPDCTVARQPAGRLGEAQDRAHCSALMVLMPMCSRSQRCGTATSNGRSAHTDASDRSATMWGAAGPWTRDWPIRAGVPKAPMPKRSRFFSHVAPLCRHPCHCPQDAELRRDLLRMDTLLAELSTAEEDAGRNAACVQVRPSFDQHLSLC